MKNLVIKSGLVLALGMSGAFAEDFCSTAKHSGQSVKITSNQTGKIGDIGYELWDENGHGGSATFYSDGSMECDITGAKDYLCRAGLSLGSNKTYTELDGDMIAEFKLVKSNAQNVGYSYIGIYGWMENVSGAPSNLVEYYVIDNTLANDMPGSWIGNERKGTITVDGGTYTVYRNTRTGPAIKTSGNVQFYQYFSVRTSPRDCGTINISEHMRQWEKLNLKMGKLYEAKVLGEAGNVNGEVRSGHMDFPHARVYIGTYTPPEPPKEIERKPFGGTAASIPGTIEAENFDEGNQGVSYEDLGNGDASDTVYNYRGTDYFAAIVGGGTGKAIGYTSADEWYEYTVNVTADGEYDVEANVSNGSSAGELILTLDGKALTTLAFNGVEGDWDTYEKVTGKANLTAGEHVLRITIGNDNTNVDYVKFSKDGVEPPLGLNGEFRLVNSGKTFQVFDMQGKFMGKVDVAAGASIKDAVKARFQNAGVYLVKQGSKMQRISIK